MSDAMATLEEVLGRYREALPYPSGTCGVVAAVCGRFVAADAFDSPSTLEAVWGRLVASYAMDAEAARDKGVKAFTAKAAGVLLEHVADQQCQAFDAVGREIITTRPTASSVIPPAIRAPATIMSASNVPAPSFTQP